MEQMALYITAWGEKYEKSDTRKAENMSWYAKQTKLVGMGIGRTLREPYPRNMTLMGTWNMIEILASQSRKHQRGWLVRGSEPLDAEGMSSLLPTIPTVAFQEAIDWFLQPKIAWLRWQKLADMPGYSPDGNPTSGKSSGESPDGNPTSGKSSGESPDGNPTSGKNSATEREEERGQRERQFTEREGTLPDAAHCPSLSEVREWARTHPAGIDPDFAQLKYEQAGERKDFEKPSWQSGWQSKFLRFWREDGPKWYKEKNKKTPRAAGGDGKRPDAWKEGDQDFWWNDSLEDVRGALRGAAMSDKKMAARIREIIALREGGK